MIKLTKSSCIIFLTVLALLLSKVTYASLIHDVYVDDDGEQVMIGTFIFPSYNQFAAPLTNTNCTGVECLEVTFNRSNWEEWIDIEGSGTNFPETLQGVGSWNINTDNGELNFILLSFLVPLNIPDLEEASLHFYLGPTQGQPLSIMCAAEGQVSLGECYEIGEDDTLLETISFVQRRQVPEPNSFILLLSTLLLFFGTRNLKRTRLVTRKQR